jgi:hypothetical protein
MESSIGTRRPKATAALLALAVVATLLVVAPAVAAACGGGVVTDVRYGAPVCIHGTEEPPAGVDTGDLPSTDELRARRFGPGGSLVAGVASANSVACIGSGTEGVRVQAVYARASNVTDRYASVAGLIAQYAADADYQINSSAALSGAGRRIRYVTTPGCALDIARVTLSTSGDDSFSAMRSELRAQGYDRTDRKYLVWVDAAVGICGIGEMYMDDRASASNYNNRGPSYARMDAPCWDYAEAHELIHTLGGVQDSAPHSTGAGHCTDEKDTMCYSDTSGLPMVTLCGTLPSWHVDCNLDDYFNAAPAADSYLSTHWNVANSVYLQGSEALPPAPSISLRAPSSFYAGTGVSVGATATVPDGRTYTITWTSSRPDCGFTAATGTNSTFSCPVSAAGQGEITATVLDSLGMSSSASRDYTLIDPAGPRATSLGLGLSKTRVRRGTRVTLSGKLMDRVTGQKLAGMPVVVYYRRSGSSRWIKLTTRVTGPGGTFAYTVRPSRTTYYKLVSYSTTTWASTQSSSKRITVR